MPPAAREESDSRTDICHNHGFWTRDSIACSSLFRTKQRELYARLSAFITIEESINPEPGLVKRIDEAAGSQSHSAVIVSF